MSVFVRKHISPLLNFFNSLAYIQQASVHGMMENVLLVRDVKKFEKHWPILLYYSIQLTTALLDLGYIKQSSNKPFQRNIKSSTFL